MGSTTKKINSKPNKTGANFSPDLVTQIKVRQEKLGKSDPGVDDILYTNSKTSWLIVASGVDINDWSKTGLGEYNQFGAKDFVLFSMKDLLKFTWRTKRL